MKILVTGGAGFIGSHVVDHMIHAGHHVWALDNLSTGYRRNLNPKAKFIKANVQDKEKLSKLFKKIRFDIVDHHAAQIDVRKSVLNPVFDAQTNILGTLHLLNLARDHRIKKFIFSASGGTAYGECKKPAREGDPEVPMSPYGVAKLSAEKYIQAFSVLYGINYTIFRYGNVYGPRQDPHGEAGVVAIFSQNLLKNKKSYIYGSGNQTRDFVYVRDVARANVLALTRGQNKILNIGTQKELSVNSLYQHMVDIVGLRKKAVKKQARAGELRRSVLNIFNAKKYLHWKPEYSHHLGLKETINYFKG